MLNSDIISEQRKLIRWVEDVHFRDKRWIMFKSSNQKINKDIKLHLNAKNLYQFLYIFPKLEGKNLEFNNFEFYDSIDFSDVIKKAKNFEIITFKDCKIHTRKDLLFENANKNDNQSIWLKNWMYYLECNNNVEEQFFTIIEEKIEFDL